MGIVAGIAEFLGDLCMKAFGVFSIYPFMAFGALGLNTQIMRHPSLVAQDGDPRVTRGTTDSVPGMSGFGESLRINEPALAASGTEVFSTMTCCAFI
jgi:hypothetical protein